MGLTDLTSVLAAREARSRHQKELLAQFGRPLICFTMNIAGPEKSGQLIEEGFRLGSTLLHDQLRAMGTPLLYAEERLLPTGPEGYYVADAEAPALKTLTTLLEEARPIGRLFDLDVLNVDGQKESRAAPRRCLLCDNPAAVCARSRAHGLTALQARTTALLLEAVQQRDARAIGQMAVQSLLYEVCITPKPGLVDRNNSGSHKDMDLFTFLRSAAALAPCFEDCARIGMESASWPPEMAFEQLRLRGRSAEGEMYRATGGVNTHKGAIFTLGLLCAACGRTGSRSPEHICAAVAELTQGLTRRETATGARKEAGLGLPTVLQTGLPALRACLRRGKSLDEAGAVTLLALLCRTQDSNIISRSSVETLEQLQNRLRAFLRDEPDGEALLRLDKEFIARNLSPGGSADLLAATLFLHFLSESAAEPEQKTQCGESTAKL